MDEHSYKKIEIIGSSKKSIEDAIQKGITKVTETARNVRWFEVVELRGKIDGNLVDSWQVTLKVGSDAE